MKLSVAPLLLATACLAPIDDEPVSTTGEVEQGLLSCDDWMCGTNSPVIANHGFWELNRFGLPNAQGLAISSFRDKFGTSYQLQVKNGRIAGIPVTGSLLANGDLVGAQIYLTHDGVLAYMIQIMQVQNTQFWASTGTPTQLQTYLFQWTNIVNGLPNGELEDLCSIHDPKPILGMNGLHTTVFEGERIDAVTKTIKPDLDRAWFNLGCAGSSLAKLQLIGHTEAARASGFQTTIPERQTALKMIGADYCGKGRPFTVAGQPLDWADDHDTLHLQKYSTLEARWTEKGASCLNVPRIKANPTPAGLAVFPDIYAAIAAECKLPPPCQGEELDGHHLISANPQAGP